MSRSGDGDNQSRLDTPRDGTPIGSQCVHAQRRGAPASEVSEVGRTRRDIVGRGIKLTFVAPVISTFLAKDAYAGSGYCSPFGASCTQDSDCCSGVCDVLGSNTCT